MQTTKLNEADFFNYIRPSLERFSESVQGRLVHGPPVSYCHWQPTDNKFPRYVSVTFANLGGQAIYIGGGASLPTPYGPHVEGMTVHRGGLYEMFYDPIWELGMRKLFVPSPGFSLEVLAKELEKAKDSVMKAEDDHLLYARQMGALPRTNPGIF